MMMPELWATLGLALLAIGTAARILVLFRVVGPWALVAMVIRVVACLVLILAFLLVVRGAVGGAASALRPAGLGLALTTLVVYVVLSWRLGEDAAAPIVDFAAMALVLTAFLAGPPKGPGLGYIQNEALRQALWLLLLVGAGGVLVAGSAAAMLVLRAALRTRTPNLLWPGWLDLHLLLKHATQFSLVGLGGGLIVGVWWVWWAGSGSPALGNRGDGLVWMISIWLVAAMSQLARCIGKRWGSWTVGLAITAAAMAALVCLLVLATPADLL